MSHVSGDAILSQAADSDRVQIWRFSAGTGSFNYAGTYDPASVRHVGLNEFVRARGGAGKYRARIRRADGTYGLTTTFSIEGQPRPWTEPETAAATSASPAIAAAPVASGYGALLEKFAGPVLAAFGAYLAKKLLDDKRTDPLVLELLKRGGGVDPLELQTAIAAAEARGEQRGRELGELKAKTEHEPPAAGEPGGALGAIERGLPKVLEVVNRHLDIEENKLRPPTPRPIAAPAGDAPTSTPAAPTDPLVALLLAVPLRARKALLEAAEDGEPAPVYAALVLSKLDDVTAARLTSQLAREDFAAVLMQTYPAFAEHPEWVNELTAALRDAVAEEDDDDDTPAAEASTAAAGD